MIGEKFHKVYLSQANLISNLRSIKKRLCIKQRLLKHLHWKGRLDFWGIQKKLLVLPLAKISFTSSLEA